MWIGSPVQVSILGSVAALDGGGTIKTGARERWWLWRGRKRRLKMDSHVVEEMTLRAGGRKEDLIGRGS